MEILRRGVNPKDRLWIGQCGMCDSIFKAREAELGKIEPADYRSDGEQWSRADCTVCGNKFAVVFHLEGSVSAKRTMEELK